MADVEQRLAAILVADVVGYSRLMGDDERATIATLREFRGIFRKIIEAHNGRVVDMAGDSVLAVFSSATGAVQAATEAQSELAKRNEGLPDDRRMLFRVGLNLGDIQEAEDGTVYGDGVNVAARLEAMASPGGINVSGTVFDSVRAKLSLPFAYLGEQEVKNINEPVRTYRIGESERTSASVMGKMHLSRNALFACGGIAAASIAAVIFAVNVFSNRGDVDRSSSADSSSTEIREQEAAALPDMPSVAVLPFKNISGDPDQTYFGEGMAEDIITDLSKVSGVFVIARNTSFALGHFGNSDGGVHEAINSAAAAQALNAQYIVAGSVRKAAELLRINVQLMDVESGENLWAERFDRDLADIFAVQDEITENVVAALKVELTADDQKRVTRHHTENLEAYDYYIRGRRLQGGYSPDSNAEAIKYLQRAVDLDSEFAAAYAELSWAHSVAWYYQWTADLDTTKQLAFDLARESVRLDDNLAEGHARLGWAYIWFGDHVRSVEQGRRAIEIDSNYADGYLLLSHILIYANLPTEGIEYAKIGMSMDPHQAHHYLAHIADGQLVMGDVEGAIDTFQRSISHNPDFPISYIWLAAIFAQNGRLNEAADMADVVLRLSPNFTVDTHAERWMLAYKDQPFGEGLVAALRLAIEENSSKN